MLELVLPGEDVEAAGAAGLKQNALGVEVLFGQADRDGGNFDALLGGAHEVYRAHDRDGDLPFGGGQIDARAALGLACALVRPVRAAAAQRLRVGQARRCGEAAEGAELFEGLRGLRRGPGRTDARREIQSRAHLVAGQLDIDLGGRIAGAKKLQSRVVRAGELELLVEVQGAFLDGESVGGGEVDFTRADLQTDELAELERAFRDSDLREEERLFADGNRLLDREGVGWRGHFAGDGFAGDSQLLPGELDRAAANLHFSARVGELPIRGHGCRHGVEGGETLLRAVAAKAEEQGVELPFARCTPYINTIPRSAEPPYPGNREIERRIKSLIRWNAMAMVVHANRKNDGIGGHISTYASCATLWEVALNHFLRAPNNGSPGDMVYFQGHASPGIYARAFLEGRLDEECLRRFRQEASGPGLSSYPHPWLMPGFWENTTVSMGLAPITAIYQARFNRYVRDRGIVDTDDIRVWCFLGDGESDEPEALGSISLASREGLDNLIFVVNCNLQRLDGPVRGNGKIIQELEAVFRGAGWNVIKVIWGSDWDPLLEADEHGLLVQRMEETVDGAYQKYSVSSGDFIREDFFGASDELRSMVEHLSDDQLRKLNRGGHDPQKVYAAYAAAVRADRPTVILAKTIKGYGLGEAGEGRNVTHQQKKLNHEELREFRARFGIPIGDEEMDAVEFYRPPEDSAEMRYLRERRRELGGFLPERHERAEPLDEIVEKPFREFIEGSERPAATTMAFVRLLDHLLRDDSLAKHLVPIVPDEARTFGMDALFRKHGIYSRQGQRYEPVDRENLLYYREATDGKILEEGITEAGSMSSFIAAGTAHARLGIEMIPIYLFYSMFGFQRIGDLIWAAADSRARGFLVGATAGRTTLAGEGLQHQDGHSHVLATTIPNVVTYDPAYAYEIAVIVRDGLRRMAVNQESLIYYLTVYNEPYVMPAMPDGAEEGILRGIYRVSSVDGERDGRPQLLGSGPILREALEAQKLLAKHYDIGSDVWSVTSYKELRRDALAVERENRLHPADAPRRCYVERVFAETSGPFVAASDYMRLVCDQIARWIPGSYTVLGTDGFGRSDTREALRRHFEVDAEHIALAALSALAEEGVFPHEKLEAAIQTLGIDPSQQDPVTA